MQNQVHSDIWSSCWRLMEATQIPDFQFNSMKTFVNVQRSEYLCRIGREQTMNFQFRFFHLFRRNFSFGCKCLLKFSDSFGRFAGEFNSSSMRFIHSAQTKKKKQRLQKMDTLCQITVSFPWDFDGHVWALPALQLSKIALWRQQDITVALYLGDIV